MEWFYDMLISATQGESNPAAWATCIVAVLIISTVLRCIFSIFKG